MPPRSAAVRSRTLPAASPKAVRLPNVRGIPVRFIYAMLPFRCLRRACFSASLTQCSERRHGCKYPAMPPLRRAYDTTPPPPACQGIFCLQFTASVTGATKPPRLCPGRLVCRRSRLRREARSIPLYSRRIRLIPGCRVRPWNSTGPPSLMMMKTIRPLGNSVSVLNFAISGAGS